MRRIYFLLVAVCLALLTGCSVHTTVEISTGANGSGSVSVESELDPSAAAAVPDLAKDLDTSDLKAAGWVISGPAKISNGDTVVKIRHGFSTPSEANRLMVDLTGATGPFQKFHLTQSRSISSVKTQFTGTVDLTRGIQSFGDGALTEKFGHSLGFDDQQVQASLGVNWPQTFPIDVVVKMPGGSAKMSSPAVNKNGAWPIAYGAVTNLKASGSATNTLSMSFLIVAIVLLIAALLVALLWKSGKYRPQHKGGGVRARDLLASAEAPTDD